MQIDATERKFMVVTAALLGVAVVALILSVAQDHATLPEPADRIRPELVRETEPFDDPGLHPTGPGTYDLVLIGQVWQWTPDSVEVPEGSTVRVLATSVDVVHGLRVPDTNANAMVIPGQVTEIEIEFDEAGSYSLICHEYCGIGHHGMYMTIEVG